MRDVNILINNGVNVQKSLELFGDMQTYDETLDIFLKEINEKINSLKKFKEIGDMQNYAIVAHGLKSEARYLGFENLGEISYKHELEGKANNLFFVTDQFENYMSEINRSVDIAKSYFGIAIEKKEVVVNKNNKKILVVDDSNIISNFINKIFSQEYEVVIASDGKYAIDIINSELSSNVVAMLLDLNMPNVNGFVVLEYFRQNDLFKKVPVSIITGLGNEDLIEQAKKYPIIEVLRKPFNERDLKYVVDKTINCLK